MGDRERERTGKGREKVYGRVSGVKGPWEADGIAYRVGILDRLAAHAAVNLPKPALVRVSTQSTRL